MPFNGSILITMKFRSIYPFAISAMLCLLGLACQSNSIHQQMEDGPSFFDWIKNDSVKDVTLRFHWDSLIKHLESEERFDATVMIDDLEFPFRLSTRGQTRKKICDFPPLHLSIPDSIDKVMGWVDFGKYKIVSRCHTSDTSSQLVLREHLAYKIANVLLPYSLEVQLCHIRYIIGGDTSHAYGFIIENEKEFAERTNLQVIEGKYQRPDLVDRKDYQRFTLFQYLLGNTDWNLNAGHNVMVFQSPGADTRSALIPYDFDYSGLVNAPYATPFPTLPISHITERLFQYRGKMTDNFDEVIEEFKLKKSQILDLVDYEPYLPHSDREHAHQYIEEFYRILDATELKEILFKHQQNQ